MGNRFLPQTLKAQKNSVSISTLYLVQKRIIEKYLVVEHHFVLEAKSDKIIFTHIDQWKEIFKMEIY